jgi:3-oxoacyl-(acyl-carrier-protein) synthase
LNSTIAITAISSVSSLGCSPNEIWKAYLHPETLIKVKNIGDEEVFCSAISEQEELLLNELSQSNSKYKSLDRSVLFAILASRKAVQSAGWSIDDVFGINMGSSRGATQLFENYHREFIETGKVQTLASPTTTLGNISTWVSHDLKSQGPDISHSITCSTALHALLNGVAWLRAGMADKFLVGGSEAPLTAFTIAQMKSMKIYSTSNDSFPCKSLDLNKTQNTMVLGEGAAVACLELGFKENALAYVEGIGYATDDIQHGVSITNEAECFQKSMKMALGGTNPNEVDVIVMHAPGTIKGDLSEFKAIQKVFGDNMPLLTSNKWKIGHTFGASGLLSLEMAVLMMHQQRFIGVPFAGIDSRSKPIRKVLINAVGFGGNGVSILISK